MIVITNKLRSYFFLILCSCFFATACAHKDEHKFHDATPPSEDLVQTFNLSQNEFEKFKVQDGETVEAEAGGKGKGKAKVKPAPKASTKPAKATEKKPDAKTLSAIVGEVAKTEPEAEGVEVSEEEQTDIDNYKKYDELAKPVWDQYQPFYVPGEEFVFEVKYLGMVAGYAQLTTLPEVKVAGQRAFHYKAHLKSARYYQYIYKLDDYVESYVTADKFLPIKYTLSQRESAQAIDDLQLYDREKLKTYYWYKKVKDGKVKKEEKTAATPYYFQDVFAVVFFARGLPLKLNDRYQFPVLTRTKAWLMDAKVESVDETIKVMDQKFTAIKVHSDLHYPKDPKKKAKVIFWYSADSERKLLKFESEVKIGSVEGVLVEYKK